MENSIHYDKGLHLSRNYPNPFTDRTTIEFSSAKDDLLELEIFDIVGQLIMKKRLIPAPGKIQKETLDLSNCPSGIYLYRLKSGRRFKTGKMLIFK